MKALITLCIASLTATAAIAQSQPTMLSQSVYEEFNGNGMVLTDSLTHTHSGGRVSYAIPDPTKYPWWLHPNDGVYTADQSERFVNPNPNLLADRITRKFNSAGMLSEYLEERKYGTTYAEVLKEWYSYDQNMLCDTQWRTVPTRDSRIIHYYQGGTLRVRLHEEYDLSSQSWKEVGVDSFIANGTDSTYIEYAKTPSSAKQVITIHQYKRDTNLRPVVDSFESYYITGSITYTDYDANGRKVRDSVFREGLGQTYKYDHKALYSYDNHGNLVSKRRHQWYNNQYASVPDLDTMTYNAVNQLTSVKAYILINDTPVVWEGPFRFYYYGFPTNVSEVAKDEHINLYPVPATSYFNIDLTFDNPEKFSLRIFDMQGRVVRAWDEPAQAAYKKHVLLDGMPAGNYLLQVHSESKNITRNFSVIN